MASAATLIQEALAIAPDQCLTAINLVQSLGRMGISSRKVLNSLHSLVDRRIVWVNTSSSRGNPQFCLVGPPSGAARNRHAVLQVTDPEEARTTGDLAKLSGMSSSAASKACHDLEAHGWLERGDPVEKHQLFFPMTGEPITSRTYDRIDDIRREFIAIIDAHEPGSTALIEALRTAVDRLLKKREIESAAKKIRSFWPELQQSALTADTRSEVKKVVGLRTSSRAVPTWRRKAEP